MKPHRVIIPNNKNEKLVGYLYKGTAKTLIIVSHGIEGNNTPSDPFLRKIIPEYFSEIVKKSGASVYSFDFSGYGESEGENFLSLRQRDKEIKSVINYFSEQYDKIILYGFSLGGLSSAIGALHNKNTAGLITVNSFFTFNPLHLLPSNVIITFSYLLAKPRFALELYYRRKNLKIANIKVPTLVVHGDNDNFVNFKQSVAFFKKLNTRKKFFSIKSKDHTLKKEYIQIPPEIAKWLKEERLV